VGADAAANEWQPHWRPTDGGAADLSVVSAASRITNSDSSMTRSDMREHSSIVAAAVAVLAVAAGEVGEELN
jgi:hypothetical protein